MKRNSKVLAAMLLLLVVAIGAYMIFTMLVAKHPSYTTGADAQFSGVITASDCYPMQPDMGCSITVKGYKIAVSVGNIIHPTLGTVTGLDVSNPLVGKTADVYAKITGNSSASLDDDAKYYVHIR